MDSQSNSNSQVGFMLWFLFGVFVLATSFVVYLLQEHLIRAWLAYRFHYYHVLAYIPFLGASNAELSELLGFLRTANPKALDAGLLWELDQYYNRFLGYAISLTAFVYGVYRFKKVNVKEATGRFDAESLIRFMAPIYPHVAYIADLDLSNAPQHFKHGRDNTHVPPIQAFTFLTMAPPPLLADQKECPPIYDISKIEDLELCFNKTVARMEFTRQLGSHLKRLADMSPVEQRAYIDFRNVLIRVAGKREAMAKIERLRTRHAYVRTFLMGMVYEFKRLGIETISVRPWLKEDRVLFLALDSVKRDMPHSEAAGCFAHAEMENVCGIRIDAPEVTAAIAGAEKLIRFDQATHQNAALFQRTRALVRTEEE